MRCPSCAAQVPESSRFCGVCGRRVGAPAVARAPETLDASASLFTVPGSKSPRLWLLFGLDLILLASGVAMLAAYVSAHDASGAASPASVTKSAGTMSVESMPPVPVSRDEREVEPAVVAVADPDGGGPSDAGTGTGARNSPSDIKRVAGQVEAEVVRRQGDLERCYGQASERHTAKTQLAGRLDVRFTIETGGSSSRVRVVRNTTGSAVLESCVKALVDGFKIGAGPPEPMDFSWPFVFRGDE